MAFKNSRYRKLPTEVTIDYTGQSQRSQSLRRIANGSGRFLHRIVEGDRIDHLAYKYYKQADKWWQICDANPDFMSPQALLGKMPFVTQRFSIFLALQQSPPWADLIRQLRHLVGVQNVWLANDKSALFITFNRLNLQSSLLAEMIEEFGHSFGFTISLPQTLGQIGQQILIPPNQLE